MKRGELRDDLYSQVFLPTKDDQPLTKVQSQAHQSPATLPPGPIRDVQFKRLEQLRNYERLVNLMSWWKRVGN